MPLSATATATMSTTAQEIQNFIGSSSSAHLPNSPWGRTPSTTRSRPNATAGAHDVPANESTIDSVMPRISPAASVPVMLPNPASTTTQNVRPMYSRSMDGSTGPTMMSMAPESAATPVAMPKAHCLMLTGFAPMSLSAGSSCATALIARPVNVLPRYRVSARVSASAMPNATIIRQGSR